MNEIMSFIDPQPVLKSLLKPSQLHDYQKAMIMHQLQNPYSAIWCFMGGGKTIATLSSTVHRMEIGEVKRTLIVAPLRVCISVWEKEARKWEHTKHLTFSLIHGDEKKKSHALFTKADIYLINYEGLPWLVDNLLNYYLNKGYPLPFESVVYDEISKLKNSQSVRFKGGRRESEDKNGNPVVVVTRGFIKIMNHFRFRTGLTGTPVSNGYLDLFGQYLALDGGDRLGKYITHYRNNYFVSDYMGWSYVPSELGKKAIESKIESITLSMTDGSKYIDLPKVTHSNIIVELPRKARLHYNEIEKELFTQLDSGVDIELFNASSVSNKLLQVCNGSAYYDLDGHWELIHKAKLDALEEVLEEAAGSPVLCAYNYKSDAEEIMRRFKKYKPVNLTAEKSTETLKILKKWNTGVIKLTIGHPASMGHGVDSLQDSGSIVVWFGLNYSLELYQQMNSRIDRQGQKSPVSIIHILAGGTMDSVVLETLNNKNLTQQNLTDIIKKYRRERK